MKEPNEVDRALCEGLNWLSAGEGPGFVVRGLERATDGGAKLAGEAKDHYMMAIESLERAEQGDHVLGWDERRRDLEEGRRSLWAARREAAREMVR